MLLRFTRDVLLKPLLLTTGFVERKQTMQILANVYIKKASGIITIVANDMEIQASVTTSEATSGDDFAITVPGKKLQDVLKTFAADAQISFNLQGENSVVVSCGRSKFVLQTLPAEHYPRQVINGEEVCRFSIAAERFRELLQQVQYAIANNDARVFLNGMFLEIKGDKLNLVATDAHRLSFATTNLGESLANIGSIIPRKTVVELYKLLDSQDSGLITVVIYPHQVAFATANAEIITKVIDAKYPDYERVLPVNNDKLCLIKREELLRSLQRISVIGFDKLKTITFNLADNQLSLCCRNEDLEESTDEISVQYQNPEVLNFSLNLSYVTDILIHSKAELLQWAFFDNERSVLITIPNEVDYKFVLMPLRA